MTTATLTDRHRANPTKLGGVVYTPPALADFLASQAFDALRTEQSVRILDPACGDGQLLLAAVATARERGIEIDQVVGYDIDGPALEKAAARLTDVADTKFVCADFLERVACESGPVDLFDVPNSSEHLDFDLVISNPPYVRTQTLGASVAKVLGERFGLAGRVDLYHAFAVAMIQALSPGGALGLLCSNKFLTNRAGASMRGLLLRELQISEIVDLGDTKLFDAAVLPVIVSGSRVKDTRRSERIPFRSVYEARAKVDVPGRPVPILEALTNRRSGMFSDGCRSFRIRNGLLDQEAGPACPWNPMDIETKKIFGTVRSSDATELGSLGKIRVGVKTTADSVFIRSDWRDLPALQQPETELIHPLLTHREIQPWSSQPGEREILYPHRDEGGRAVAVNLANFPGAAAYLNEHRARLESRTYVTQGSRNWFEIWVPQKPALWSRQKIVFPDIAEVPRFAIDRSGSIVNGDCYWMVVDDDDLAEVIAAVGNSSFCTWFYDAACGNYLYAGRRRFMTQYIERLPIPAPKRDLVDKIRELRVSEDLDRLDALVWTALGLKQSAR
ncbi:MAG: N-6 DNA methylase [Acidimicrobiaceae bacterium]|nr:N-6 DNA methylase [Acidimicrobiaceae bacterium]MYA73363.1 N-6 DNA methylase [Acidimicrobiaceae bacterium]MYD05446.1 N-6 DNA methylase [Acidimicrobiaceae bacterium]MYG54800.1 N-6 DNA methylase [Acidimicrobiaceae bacterium]MYI59905.1 N-6 DNA methylase [Acidimicrobiaceae bacterium]